jgi:hypothetical protein
MSETPRVAERADDQLSDAGTVDDAAGDTVAAATPSTPTPGTPTPGTPTPSTADPRVDDALSRLAEMDALPLTEQVEVYADIHRRLAGVLADPDSQA